MASSFSIPTPCFMEEVGRYDREPLVKSLEVVLTDVVAREVSKPNQVLNLLIYEFFEGLAGIAEYG